jgi:hypothetical protein
MRTEIDKARHPEGTEIIEWNDQGPVSVEMAKRKQARLLAEGFVLIDQKSFGGTRWRQTYHNPAAIAKAKGGKYTKGCSVTRL